MDPDRLVARTRLTEPATQVLTDGGTVFIEAQVGHGKTTLAAQCVSSFSGSVSWYDLDPADRDPVRLLASLLHAVAHVFPASANAPVFTMVERGDITSSETSMILVRSLAGLRSGCSPRALYDCQTMAGLHADARKTLDGHTLALRRQNLDDAELDQALEEFWSPRTFSSCEHDS